MTESPTVPLRSPQDLIDVVPYLLGFHPRDSVVVVGLRRTATSNRVTLAIRFDLSDVVSLQRADRGMLLDPMVRSAATEVIVLVFTGDAHPDRGFWRDEVGADLARAAAGHGIELMDHLLVTDDRWWSLVCADPVCSPDEGRVRTSGPSDVVLAATVAGMVALGDRTDVARLLQGDPPERRQRLEDALGVAEARAFDAVVSRGSVRRRNADRAVLFALADRVRNDVSTALSDTDLARMGVALTDIALRDQVWTAIDDRSLDALDLMSHLHRRLPTPYDAAPLFLHGWSLWRAGNGLLAVAAAEAALRSDPDYTAAELLLVTVQAGLDPVRTPPLASIDLESEAV